MADFIARLKVDSKEYDSKIERARSGLLALEKNLKESGKDFRQADEAQIKFVQDLGKMETVSRTAAGRVNEMTKAFVDLSVQYKHMSDLERQSPIGKAMAASLGQLKGRINSAKSELAGIQSSLGGVSKGGLGAGIMQGMGSAFSMLGPAALAAGGVTAAIGGLKKVMGDMVQINMQFEQSSSNLAAVMGKTRDEITPLTDQAKQLGATTQYTANQILELQANLARLGFNETEILNSTKAVQGMATAMGADLGEAANLAGSALRGFGLNATEMERVASVLSVGTTKSALSFEKLATALPIVQTAAAKTGFTIEDTVAMLGKLTDNGINAASAATQLRKILNDSTTAGTKLANALGGPVKSFDELVVALDKANKAGQNHADSVALVNSKNATALDILRDMAAQRTVEIDGVQKQTSALQDLRDSITDCSDGMRAMQDEQLNTLQGSITILNSAWEGLMLTFSESNGVIKTVVDSLTDLLGAWTKWRKRNQGGDAAVSTEELGADADAAKKYIEEGRAGGQSDDQIIAAANERKAALEQEAEAILKAEDLYKKYEQAMKEASLAGTSGNMKMINAAYDKVDAAKAALAATGYDVNKGGVSLDQIYKDAAAKKDEAATMGLVISSLTPNKSGNTTTTEDGDQEDKTKGFLAKRRAQIEAGMQKEIADLDKANMIKEGKEAEYEERVYQIKRAALEQISKLYQEDTTERAKAEAAISSLDIQYQGTQMRLANKADKGSKPKPKEEKLLNYSQEGIANLGSQIKSAMSKSEIGSKGYLLAADKLLDFTTFEGLLKAATERGMQPDPEWMASLFEDIKIGAGVTDETWQALVDDINAKLEELKLPPITLDVKTGGVEEAKNEMGGLAENVQGAIGVFGQLGSAMQQIEDPGAKVAGMIMEAIAGIAATFAASLKGTFTPWDWIAAAISGTATMIGVISSIKSVTSGSYASGGIIPGNSYSGDNLTANVNSGELILNRAQQASIAGQLSGGATQTVVVEGRISGKDILLSANNTNRAAGGSRGYYANVK